MMLQICPLSAKNSISVVSPRTFGLRSVKAPRYIQTWAAEMSVPDQLGPMCHVCRILSSTFAAEWEGPDHARR